MATANSHSGVQVSVTILSQMFYYLASLNVDVDSLLRSLNIDPATVKSPDTYIPAETYLRIEAAAAAYVSDPYFGLRMGQFAEPASWSILGYMLMNCKTVGEAFEKSGRYVRITGNMIETGIKWRSNKIKMVFFAPPHAPRLSRHCYESVCSSTMRLMRKLTGIHLCPLEVTFIAPAPESIEEYEQVFCCPVRFGCAENSMTVDARIAHTPIRMANPSLYEHFEKYAQDFLARMERKDEHTRAVTKIILARLDDEKLSIDKVAKEMSISVRTLQKRLEDEGVVFSDLLQDIRQRLAKKYLQENYSVEQITYLLGFSEPSVFRKAFKKWSGITPREYRQSAFSDRWQV